MFSPLASLVNKRVSVKVALTQYQVWGNSLTRKTGSLNCK